MPEPDLIVLATAIASVITFCRKERYIKLEGTPRRSANSRDSQNKKLKAKKTDELSNSLLRTSRKRRADA